MAGKAFICNDVIGTYIKKHSCPTCNIKLKRIKVSKTINPNSEEANSDFFKRHIAGFKKYGDIKFTWHEFECSSCKRHFILDELDEIESNKG